MQDPIVNDDEVGSEWRTLLGEERRPLGDLRKRKGGPEENMKKITREQRKKKRKKLQKRKIEKNKKKDCIRRPLARFGNGGLGTLSGQSFVQPKTERTPASTPDAGTSDQQPATSIKPAIFNQKTCPLESGCQLSFHLCLM